MVRIGIVALLLACAIGVSALADRVGTSGAADAWVKANSGSLEETERLMNTGNSGIT